MVCPICNERKSKRFCPAKGVKICAVCCGTKRIVEINCPADCVYLTSAKSHPPAVVQRQVQSDRAAMLPLLQGFSERQARVFLMLGSVVARHKAEGFQRLLDGDIAQATQALASTLETASRGIVYEHQPASLPAARLMGELKAVVEEISKAGGSGLERDAALALRRFEEAAKSTSNIDAQSTLFQDLLSRVLSPPPGTAAPEPDEPTAPASSLIIP